MKEKAPAEGGIETTLLVLIMLAVGGMAMAASFTHVKDFTMANVPAGTPEWFGWANAVISELTPVAALLEIRRRGRARQPLTFPMWVLIGSTAVSLTANLALAERTAFGWLVFGLPAVAFGVLTKMVLSGLPKRVPVPDEVPAQAVPAMRVLAEQVSVPAPAVPSTPALPVPSTRPVPVPEVKPVPSTPQVPVPTEVPLRPAPVPSTPEPAIVVPGPPRRVRKPGTGTDDGVLVAKLKEVLETKPDEVLTKDGTLGVKRVAGVLGTGPDRARRLIEQVQVPVPA